MSKPKLGRPKGKNPPAVPTSISIPTKVLKQIDDDRGQVSRSKFLLNKAGYTGVRVIAFPPLVTEDATPLPGAQIFIFDSDNKRTPFQTYADKGLTIPQTHPIVVSNSCEAPKIYFTGTSIHVLIRTADGDPFYESGPLTGEIA